MVNSVMIIDDSVDDQYLAQRSLSYADLCRNFFLKNNGQEALDFFLKYKENQQAWGDRLPPALVLLDVNMPVMNGFEFLEAFRQLRETNKDLENVKIVILSSSNDKEDRERAKSYTFVRDYWIKSLGPKGIIEKFKQVFSEAG